MNTNSCRNSDKKTQKNPIPVDATIDETVIVIGAGWSGLACAVTLVQKGYKVCLLESARYPGGRARSVHFKNEAANRSLSNQIGHIKTVDNGQHIMLGAYHYTRTLFKSLGLIEADILEQHPLELKMISPTRPHIHLNPSPVPAPLHLLFALLKSNGFTFFERFKAIQMALKLAITGYNLKQDISVNELLIQHNQTQNVICALWEPLCLATMNTPIRYASGQVFLNVLKDSFSRKRQDSNLLFFKYDLSHIFCRPAIEFIIHHGGQVICASKVTELQISKTDTTALFYVKTNHKNFHSRYLVMATPAHITDKLLHSAFNQALFQKQSFLKPQNASLIYSYEPICTIYLQYPTHIRLPNRMIGLFNTTGQWAIDRSVSQQYGLIAVVISGPGKHLQMSHEQLANTIHNELGLIISDLPTPYEFKVIREKKATFSCRVNIERQRPETRTLIPGLFLAGDFTDTGYPSTLEGAIKSGVIAARHIILNL